MPHSLLIMSYGQSNADCHDAGPAYQTECLQDSRIVVPNDGFGFRGRLARTNETSITGFDPAFDNIPGAQSIGMAAAAGYLAHTPNDQPAQIVVRSAGRGGRPLISRFHREREIEGIYKEAAGAFTMTFQTLLNELAVIAENCAAMGAPLRHVYLPLFHGEADQGNDPQVYAKELTNMMDDVDAYLQTIGLKSDWLMTQPSGTILSFSGNAWKNRLVLDRIARDRPNAHLACANYGYSLADAAHLDARGKALIGEILGLTMAEIRDKALSRPVALKTLVTDGAQLDLIFDSPRGLVLDRTRFPDPEHICGFQLLKKREQLIKTVEQVGERQFRLTCQHPVERGSVLNYAFARGTHAPPDGIPFPFGRGCIREDWTQPSITAPGEELLRWIPSFSAPLEAAIAQLSAA